MRKLLSPPLGWFVRGQHGAAVADLRKLCQQHEGTLSSKYGPLTKVVVRSVGEPDDQPQEDDERDHSKFRASVTFRQCGFAVEVATGISSSAEAALSMATTKASSMDILFINPQAHTRNHTYNKPGKAESLLKSQLDEMRGWCSNWGRMMKFSLAQKTADQFTCKAYMRDEWATVVNSVPILEVSNKSANVALVEVLRLLYARFAEEITSEDFLKADLKELQVIQKAERRVLRDTCQEEAPDADSEDSRQLGGYSVFLTVTDEFDNSFSVTSRVQRTILNAYNVACGKLAKYDNDNHSSRPLLFRLRWQLEGMALLVFGFEELKMETLIAGPHEMIYFEFDKDGDGVAGVGKIVFNGVVIAESRGEGLYKVEVEAYTTALRFFISKHAQVAATHFPELFPTVESLNAAVEAHDNFNVLQIHRGKWNPYAVLGTITNCLLGSCYNVRYIEDTERDLCSAILYLNDGHRSDRVIEVAIGRLKGEAWRKACEHCIKMNFPMQNHMLTGKVEYGMSTESQIRNVKFRALPREKRIQHMSSLFHLVQVFGEEDFGWRDVQLVCRQAGSSSNWICEVHCTVDKNPKVILMSQVCGTAKAAKKQITLSLMKKYWSMELLAYLKLGRGDYCQADAEPVLNAVFDNTRSFLSQMIALLTNGAAEAAPFTISISVKEEGKKMTYTSNVISKGDRVVGTSEAATAVDASLNACFAACTLLNVDRSGLWKEYLDYHPVAKFAISRDYCQWLLKTFFGAEAQFDYFMSTTEGWIATVSVLFGGTSIILCRELAKRKADSSAVGLTASCAENFFTILKHHSKNSEELHVFADATLKAMRPGVQRTSTVVVDPIVSSRSSPDEGIVRLTSGGQGTPLGLLKALITREDPNWQLRHEHALMTSGAGYRCTLTKHLRDSTVTKEVGCAVAKTKAESLHVASVSALENIFEHELAVAIEANDSFCEFPRAVEM